LLEQLLANSNWAYSGRYRREDVCQMMEGILDQGSESDMHPDAVETVESMFCELISILE
jgi:hypothetical protein